MIKHKSTFFLGIFILIVSSSFLGLPSMWKTFLIFISGLTLIILSVDLNLPKKSQKRLPKKEKSAYTVETVSLPQNIENLEKNITQEESIHKTE